MGEAKKRSAASEGGLAPGGFYLRVVFGPGEALHHRFPGRDVPGMIRRMDQGMAGFLARFPDPQVRHNARMEGVYEAGRALRDDDHVQGRRFNDPIHVYRTLLWLAATQTPKFREAVEQRSRNPKAVLTVFLDDLPQIRFGLSNEFVDAIPRTPLGSGEVRQEEAWVAASETVALDGTAPDGRMH